MDKPVVFRGRVVVSLPREVDVRALREKLGMTQNLFAARFGFPLATLKHWEYGRRRPSGASLALLNVIAHNPRAVLQALRSPADRGLRPIDAYVAAWEAERAREQEERAAAIADLQEERDAVAFAEARRKSREAFAAGRRIGRGAISPARRGLSKRHFQERDPLDPE